MYHTLLCYQYSGMRIIDYVWSITWCVSFAYWIASCYCRTINVHLSFISNFCKVKKNAKVEECNYHQHCSVAALCID